MSKCYALISENLITVEDCSPEINLTRFIFYDNYGYGSTFNVIKNIDEIMDLILRNFSEDEKNILILLHGIGQDCPLSMSKVAKKLNMDKSIIHYMRRNAVKRLESKEIFGVIQGITWKLPYNLSYCAFNSYIQNLKETLSFEIKHIIEGDNTSTIYLSNILKRNNIEIESDLKNEDNDTIDEFVTIYLTIDGQKIIYKYSGVDYTKIANSLFLELINYKADHCNIFESCFSPGLINLLLMKGYLYEEDVIQDSSKLIQELSAFEFSEFVKEIEELKRFYRIHNLPDSEEKVYVCFDEAIIKLIKDENIKDLDQFINSIEQKKDDDLSKELEIIMQCL